MEIKVDLNDLNLEAIVKEMANAESSSAVYTAPQNSTSIQDNYSMIMGHKNKGHNGQPPQRGKNGNTTHHRRTNITWGRMNVGDNR